MTLRAFFPKYCKALYKITGLNLSGSMRSSALDNVQVQGRSHLRLQHWKSVAPLLDRQLEQRNNCNIWSFFRPPSIFVVFCILRQSDI